MAVPAGRTRVEIGDARVTYLPDGHGVFDPAVVFPAIRETRWVDDADILDTDGRLTMSFGAFLIQAGERHILVDLGMGPADLVIPDLGRVRGGRLLASLAEEGLGPADIDTVVFTHLHPDHVGWTTAGAATGLTFARARHLAAAEEWHYWVGGDRPGGPDPVTVVKPLTGVLQLVTDGAEVAPGVHVRAAPGHTPGHLCVVVTDPAGRTVSRAMIIGDLMHSAAQVVHESWLFFQDVDPDRARRTRARILAESADGLVTIAGGHFADQVFGTVQTSPTGRSWTPVAAGC